MELTPITIITGQRSAADDRAGATWSGVLPTSGDTQKDLEAIFRGFNRVTEADCERLDALGYQLPSLTAGDIVLLEGQAWYCAPSGWQPWSRYDVADRMLGTR